MEAADHYDEALRLHREGGDFLPALKEASRALLKRFHLRDVGHVQILISGESACPECRAQADQVVTLQEAFLSMPIPVENCSNGFCRCTYIEAVEGWEDAEEEDGDLDQGGPPSYLPKLDDDWDDPRARRRNFPGTLWLLPIFFGILGGIVAALIASLKYESSWWELVFAGIAMTVVAVLIYMAAGTALFSMLS
jgi:hypothetical protein